MSRPAATYRIYFVQISLDKFKDVTPERCTDFKEKESSNFREKDFTERFQSPQRDFAERTF